MTAAKAGLLRLTCASSENRATRDTVPLPSRSLRGSLIDAPVWNTSVTFFFESGKKDAMFPRNMNVGACYLIDSVTTG
ncbi:hypothetical protein [Microbacterium sp. 13-71-7]|jgi:hypothetical protein|uniref:hypothetical protein n=1 Tax=Microbacterium sp. 13-71-7 TaxID=1970399 RepID=UPI0025E03249|nr:hypothetical protein [Microbacterium sp. 13-71-7]